MPEYTTYSVNLSEGQKKKLAKAAKTMSSISLKLTHSNLQGDHPFPLTNTQINGIHKAYQNGKGYTLNLSATQMKQVVSGGFLPFLVPILASLATGALSGAASFGVNKLLQKTTGSGFDEQHMQNANIVGKGNPKKKVARGLYSYGQVQGRGMIPL